MRHGALLILLIPLIPRLVSEVEPHPPTPQLMAKFLNFETL
jgi:hypothetical protein